MVTVIDNSDVEGKAPGQSGAYTMYGTMKVYRMFSGGPQGRNSDTRREGDSRIVVMRCAAIRRASHPRGATAYKCEGELISIEPSESSPEAKPQSTDQRSHVPWDAGRGRTTFLTLVVADHSGMSEKAFGPGRAVQDRDSAATTVGQDAGGPDACVLLRMEVRSPRPGSKPERVLLTTSIY